MGGAGLRSGPTALVALFGVAPGRAPFDVAALLLVRAAHLHGAPAPAVVPAGVQKDPVATGAKLEPPQIPRRQKPRGRVRNGPQHPTEVPPVFPLPGEGSLAPHEPPPQQSLPLVTA